jgi:hypothetical protein
MSIRRLIATFGIVGSLGASAVWLAAPAGAVKPSQGSTFETGTCTTTTGHGSNAVQTTDTGSCKSADNPNQGGTDTGTNTGHGFVSD